MLPSLSKTMYGCSVRAYTWTRSCESHATPATWPHFHPSGSLPQPSTNSYCRSPASILMTVTLPLLLRSRSTNRPVRWVHIRYRISPSQGRPTSRSLECRQVLHTQLDVRRGGVGPDLLG